MIQVCVVDPNIKDFFVVLLNLGQWLHLTFEYLIN